MCSSDLNLRIVGGDKEKVLQRQWPREPIFVGIAATKQLVIQGLHPRDLLVALLNVPIMLDAAKNNPALARDETVRAGRDNNPLLGTVRMRLEAALIDALGNESADGWVHPAGFAQEEAIVCWDDGMEDRHIGQARHRILQCILQY